MKTLFLIMGMLLFVGCAATDPETREFNSSGQIVTGGVSHNSEISPPQHVPRKDSNETCEKVVSIYGEIVDLECN